MGKDRIWLNGIECRVHLGVPDQERKRRQKILIDVGLELDISQSAAGDDFTKTVDYWGLEKAVRAEAESRERRLLETVAEDVARLVLSRERLAQGVWVRARKKPAVMPKTREVVVEICRTRRRN